MSGSVDENNDPTLDFASSSTDPLENSLIKGGIPPTVQPDNQPMYQVMGNSKIVVAKSRGKLWKSRKAAGKKNMTDFIDAWDEAIRYYNSDQSDHRDTAVEGTSANRNVARRLNERWSSTENIVFSNINAQVPSLYAKNPTLSITAGINQDQDARDDSNAFARVVERLVNCLFAMRQSPGVNVKPKFKKAVVIALLTNCCWIETGYTMKDKSSEAALKDLQDLSTGLMQAKDTKEIAEIEGKLMALEERIEFLTPSGPFVRIRLPHQVICDPDMNAADMTDCKWVIVEDMLPTSYINAVYASKNPDTGEVSSLYEPTHVLDSTASRDDDESTDNLSIFSDKKDYNAYGYADKNSFDKAKRTRVSYVWDATTKRLEMYSDISWDWPIWVWDDPYQLAGFFPLTKLSFHENPVAAFAKGEVSYYLDQQDEINEINDEKRRARAWARRNIAYDSNKVSKDEVTKLLNGADGTAVGVKVPEGMKIQDMLHSIVPPSFQFMQLFDKKDLYASIDRIAATNEIERGGEFKTNTTNKAVDYYSTQGNQRNDERLDAVEDAIANVGWQVAQMCLRFMDAQTVTSITGLQAGDEWKALDPLGDMNRWSMTCVGGSTTKMSATQRKQEAVQVGQVLAQFAKAAPASVLTTTLQMFERAFDDVVIQQEDWQKIIDEVAKTLAMSAGGAPGAGGQPNAPGAGGAPPPPPGAPPSAGPAPNAGGGGDPAAMGTQIVQALSSLPPDVVKAIGAALAQGATPQQVFQEMMQHHGAA